MNHDVYEKIRRLIANGEYIGGDVLPEVELAVRVGASRTPVREALSRLQAEGICERRGNRRVYLIETEAADVVGMFTVRAALEPIAARVAALQMNEKRLEHLTALVDKMEAMQSQYPQDLRGYRLANEEFHWSILSFAEQHEIESTVRSVARKPLVSTTFNAWEREELERSQHHHRELISAFRVRDSDWAEAIMRCHMLAARAAFARISALARKNESDGDGSSMLREGSGDA